MSQLGIKLVWYALEITPVLIAALVLSFLSTRRGPARVLPPSAFPWE